MGKHYISNKDESARMFRSDFLERFTHVHPLTPHAIFGPVVLYVLYSSLQTELGATGTAALFAFGLGLWTFMEYVLHRFVFHLHPRNAWQKRLYFMLHGVHHDH